MYKINEAQILTNVRLSHAQKYVLSKLILPNATPLTSYENVSSGKNVVANRNVLVKLGMVQIGANEAKITDKGIDALKNENLIDDMGNLTQQGEQYAYASSLEDIEKIAAQQNNEPETPSPEQGNNVKPSQNIPQQPTDTASQVPDGAPFPESWEMLSDIQNAIHEKHFIQKHSKKS